MDDKLGSNMQEFNLAISYQHPYAVKSPLRVLVTAQEDRWRLVLRRILKAEAGVQIIAECADVSAAIAKIDYLRPDLVFWDMQLDRADPLDIISGPDYLPEIILTSCLGEDALRAYETGSLDFLLKPASPERIRRAITKAHRILNPERHSGREFPLEQTIARRSRPAVSRLAVHKGKRVLLLNLKDIYFIKVENRLVFAFTGYDRYLVNRTIIELEQLLHDDGFLQINRATVINLDYLLEIIPWFSGTYRLKLANEMEFPLSRDRVSQLKAAVGLPGRWSGK